MSAQLNRKQYEVLAEALFKARAEALFVAGAMAVDAEIVRAGIDLAETEIIKALRALSPNFDERRFRYASRPLR